MRILTIDIGTGTQDIYLYDSRLDLENGFKLIVPSPTMIVYRRLQEAARRGEAVALTGVTMGGGPSGWAAEAYMKAGLPLYATPPAARTFNDDLAAVQASGIQVISEEEVLGLPAQVRRLRLCDFDFPAIATAFAAFGVSLNQLDAVAAAVFDHGAAPPEVSDRQFRFDYLEERLRQTNRLAAFAYRADQIPPIMTRLQAVADSAREIDAPLVVMDTAPAAILGSLFDPQARRRKRLLAANVGNFHTLAFRLGAPEGDSPASRPIEGVFEHHTGLLHRARLESLLRALAAGQLRHAEVFNDHGHGALVCQHEALPLGEADFDVMVSGPRRAMLHEALPGELQPLRPYFAVPFGDMMIAGCFGLLAATAERLPDLAGPIWRSLSNAGGQGKPPWETD